jgi:4'-phosphopantetheinyl transferase
LRHLLGQHLQIDPLDVTLSTTKYGKPYTQQLYGTHELMFNVTHSHECALIAITLDRLVGVDIEHFRNVSDIDNIAKQFFAAGENAKLQMVPPEQKQTAFLKCWTRKEAFIKAIGEGLSHPLHQFEVTFLPDEQPRLLYDKSDPQAAQKWQLFDLVPDTDYIAALIVAARPTENLTLRYYQL